MGFPQLKEAKGFEIMNCSSNSRDLAVVKTSWSVKDLKSVFTSQTKVYLRPIQKSLRTKVTVQHGAVCKLKEMCMWCEEEFPVSELRGHLIKCSGNFFDDHGHTGEYSDMVTNQQVSDIADNSVVSLGDGTPEQPIVLSDSASAGMSLNQNHTSSVSNQGRNPAPAGSTNVDDIVADGTSPMTSSESVPASQSKTTDLLIDIDTIMPKIVEHCHRTQISDNPVEMLRYMQMQLVQGRALDVSNVAECESGETAYILVDRQQLLETSFDEIETTRNKYVTLEVQFYGEVS